jgi:hypothetical protein
MRGLGLARPGPLLKPVRAAIQNPVVLDVESTQPIGLKRNLSEAVVIKVQAQVSRAGWRYSTATALNEVAWFSVTARLPAKRASAHTG